METRQFHRPARAAPGPDAAPGLKGPSRRTRHAGGNRGHQGGTQEAAPALLRHQDRPAYGLGLLAFLNPLAAARHCGRDAETPLAELIADAGLRQKLADGLAAHNRANPGSSTRIARLLLMAVPPNIDANEITDKGYINQRAVLERRASDVERLYGDDPEAIRVPTD